MLGELDRQRAVELRGMLGGPGDDSVERSLEQLGQVASEIGLAALGPGSRVEGFELGEPIGEGGMGQVFEATQLQPRRRVALKVMRFGLDSSQLATMFEAEAETLARLGHPAIAHVYAAGLMRRGDAEIPWFAMELVDGAMPVTRFADALENHQAAGMLTVEGDAIRTTPDGLLVVDTLLPAFFRPEHISDRYV